MSNIKFLKCIKYFKNPIIKSSINNTYFTKSIITTIPNNNNLYKINYSTFNRFSKSTNKPTTTTTTNTPTTTTTNTTNLDENFNFKFVNPETIKPFKARHLPWETTSDLDFIISPGHIPIESEVTLEKYLKLAKALSAVGYENQEQQRWEEAIESYNKALFYIRNIFASPKFKSKIDLRDFAVLLSNSGESFSRIDKQQEAMTRTKQAIDILEYYWKDYVNRTSNSVHNRNLWKKDEMLGIFYSNYSEHLVQLERYQEAEPFLVRAHEILSIIYPLNHPINVEIGISLVKVLNEMGRSKQVDNIFEKFGDTITDAMGKTQEFKHISEKVETDIKFQMIEQIKDQYPELNLDHKDFEGDEHDDQEEEEDFNKFDYEYDKFGNIIKKEKQLEQEERDEEEDEIIKYKYQEKEFNYQDLLILEENTFEKNKEIESALTISTINQERDFKELEEQDEDEESDDDEFSFDQGDEDEGDREDLGDDNQLHPREEMLNLQLEQDEGQFKGQPVFPTNQPLSNVLNDFDTLFDEATEKYTEIQAERVVDREERLLNKHSGIPEKVVWQDGVISTPTDSRGEPISQGAIDKWGKYYAEDLFQQDIQEEEQVLDQYIDKMENLMESMSKSDSRQLNQQFNQMFPKFKKLLSQPGGADKYLNTSLMDVEQDEQDEKQLLLEELELLKERYQELDDDGIKTEDESDFTNDEDDSYFDYNDNFNLDSFDETEQDVNIKQIGNDGNGGKVDQKNLIEFINTASNLNFDQDKILKKIGEKEFNKLQNQFNLNDQDDDGADGSEEGGKDEDLLKNLFKKSKIQDDQDASLDDYSLNHLLNQLEEFDKDENGNNNNDLTHNDDDSIDFNEIDQFNDFEDDLNIPSDSNNPEKDLEKYLKKVENSDTFQDFLKDINNNKK